MFFAIVGFLFSLFTHAALVAGIAVLVLKRRGSLDHSSVLPFATVPLIPVGLLMLYAFGAEAFISFYGANKFEADAMALRMFGPYSAAYFLNLVGVIFTQIFWLSRFRDSAAASIAVGLLNLFP